MKTNKRRHKHTNKRLKKKEEKNSLTRRHKRHRRHRNKKTSLSSWDKHYNTYESDIVNSEVNKSNYNKDNNVQSVHGLKDFLQGKKSKG